MERQGIKRLALVSVAVAALLGGVGVHPSGAKNTDLADIEYSQSDCETILNIQVDDASNGYFGATARNAAKAYRSAAKKIDDAKLKRAMNSLAGIWAAVGRENDVTVAARITAKKSKAYGKALGVYTKAVVWCGSHSFDEETTTTTFEESSDFSSDSTSDTSSESSE